MAWPREYGQATKKKRQPSPGEFGQDNVPSMVGGPNHEAPFGGYKESGIMPGPLASLTANQECELLIAGGGFTGLWAAMQAQF
jgi:hypothetical protein